MMKKTMQRLLMVPASMLLLTNFLVGCGGSNEQTPPNSGPPINSSTDKKAPTITGLANLTVNLGDEVNLLTGITADDDVDGDLTSEIIITGEVNVNSVGVYILYYSVSDKAGNSTSKRRDITVVDIEPPIISGLANLTVNLGDEVNLLTGITAVDDVDGDLTSEIIITGEVKVNSAGVYILYYSVSDKAGNSTSERRDITVVDVIDVVDIEPPVISGVSHVTLEQRATFDSLAGISASDNVDGNITDSVQTIGDFDITMPGFYQLSYQVSDQAGNTTTITRDITVVAADSPLTTTEAVCAIF